MATAGRGEDASVAGGAVPSVERTQLPRDRSARIDVLTIGYVRPRTASTCTLVRDGSVVLVVDPGMVADRSRILDPLRRLGVTPEAVTDVVFSHHHPDHTLNAALFASARFHDHWAIYHDDDWESRDADGFELSPSIRLLRTPGHTREDISTLVGTPDGVLVLTHLWWDAEGPLDDPHAVDAAALHRHRARIMELADRIVPAHGSPFTPGSTTPR